MRLALVTITLMGSVGAAITLLPNTPLEDRLAVVSDIGKSGEARLDPPATAPATSSEETRYRTFGFPIGFSGSNTARETEVERVEPARVSAIPARVEATTVSAAPPIVNEASPPRPVAGDGQLGLTTAVQLELRRIGCYSGALDGDWGPASRRGLQAFMDEAGTALSVRQPDHVTLTLLRGYAGQVCGADCPVDRRSPSTGACLSGPTLASRAIKRTPEQTRQADEAGERMAGSGHDAGPRFATSSGITVQPVQSPTGSFNSALVTTTTVDISPVLVQGPSRVNNPRNSQALEGRMAIGGPAVVVTPVDPPAGVQTVLSPPDAGQDTGAQPPSRASHRPNRSWSTGRRSTSWTATFFDR